MHPNRVHQFTHTSIDLTQTVAHLSVLLLYTVTRTHNAHSTEYGTQPNGLNSGQDIAISRMNESDCEQSAVSCWHENGISCIDSGQVLLLGKCEWSKDDLTRRIECR